MKWFGTSLKSFLEKTSQSFANICPIWNSVTWHITVQKKYLTHYVYTNMKQTNVNMSNCFARLCHSKFKQRQKWQQVNSVAIFQQFATLKAIMIYILLFIWGRGGGIFRNLHRAGNPILHKPDATRSTGRVELALIFFRFR